MKKIFTILALMASLVFASSAQDATTPEAETPTLTGSQWQLVSFSDGRTETPAEGKITLDFAEEQMFSGNGGCNTYSGQYTLAVDGVTFGDVRSTRMACVEEKLSAQEAQYFTLLPAMTSAHLQGRRLVLSADDGRGMIFAARGAYGLIGSSWELTAYGSAGAETAVIGEAPVVLDFVDATDLNGFGGCNGYGSTYSADDETLTIGQIVGTLMACEPDIMAQETAYFALLPAVVRYAVADDTLTLYTADEQYLQFTASGLYALTRVGWIFTGFVEGSASTPVIDDSMVTLDFRTDGTAGGNAGCNMFSGAFAVEGDALTFGQMVSTLMACMDGKMAQESAFLAALGDVERFAIEDGVLVLYHGETGELHFAPVGAVAAADEA